MIYESQKWGETRKNKEEESHETWDDQNKAHSSFSRSMDLPSLAVFFLPLFFILTEPQPLQALNILCGEGSAGHVMKGRSRDWSRFPPTNSRSKCQTGREKKEAELSPLSSAGFFSILLHLHPVPPSPWAGQNPPNTSKLEWLPACSIKPSSTPSFLSVISPIIARRRKEAQTQRSSWVSQTLDVTEMRWKALPLQYEANSLSRWWRATTDD